eukprot:CAMPEP_0183553850 /NCGR_PEP_ID=MMETSP0371-20130417/76115_1 /TAXON_ID=268820 /ORGANISM="Peridinium aciculiferum, Strain PAER-2" /LENGTH=81 /DNA_ID=CAMNT_0025759479 /DNA_START=17 /DNA_END=260 /DNA_ORIENTATION=-
MVGRRRLGCSTPVDRHVDLQVLDLMTLLPILKGSALHDGISLDPLPFGSTRPLGHHFPSGPHHSLLGGPQPQAVGLMLRLL